MLLILYHIVIRFVFISHVKKKKTLGQAVGLGGDEAYFLICLT